MWYKWTKRILATIGILIALIVTFIVTVLFLYEDEIKQYATEELNRHLKVNVVIKPENIDLTFWDQFPKTSLKFHDVWIPDYTDSTLNDTLIYAEDIYLNFDFWDVLAGRYQVKNIVISKAVTHLKINQLGEANYNIWKTDTVQKKQDDPFSFALEKVMLNEVKYSYENQAIKQSYSGYSPSLTLTGDFTNEMMSIKANAKIKKLQVTIDSLNWIKNKSAKLDLNLLINLTDSLYTIKQGDLKVEDLLFSVNGDYSYKHEASKVSLNLEGKNINLQSAASVFPNQYMHYLYEYDAKGLLVFKAKLNGELSTTKAPSLWANFYVNQGSIKEKKSGTKLKNLTFDGYFHSDTLSGSYLSIEDLSGNFNAGTLGGEMTYLISKESKLDVASSGNVSLKQLHGFLSLPGIKSADGNAEYEFNLTAYQNKEGLYVKNSSGILNLNKASIIPEYGNLSFTDLVGLISLKNNSATLDIQHGKLNNKQFNTQLDLKNILTYSDVSAQKTKISGYFSSESIDLADFIDDSNSKQSETEKESNTLLPENLILSVNFSANSFRYQAFKCENLVTQIKLNDKIFRLNHLKLDGQEGHYSAGLEFKEGTDTYDLSTDIVAKNVDLNQLFIATENFRQEYVTHHNLKGKANFLISAKVQLDNQLNVIPPTIDAKATLDVKNGQLKNQKSLVELGKYFSTQPVLKKIIQTDKFSNEIKDIKVKSLINTITIKNSEIFIPDMEINSNIIDLGIGGSQTFSDQLDYHFRIKLRDVLIQKNSNTEFGEIQDDGLGKVVFIRMFGHIDNLQYEIDKQAKQQEKAENIKQEKAELKSILKEEFGLFKKDSTVQNFKKKDEKKTTFQLEGWDEFDDTTKVEVNHSNKSEEKQEKPKEKKELPKWLKKLGVEEEKKSEVKIDIEN